MTDCRHVLPYRLAFHSFAPALTAGLFSCVLATRRATVRPMNKRTYSQSGLELTEGFEGYSEKAYWDATGKRWTIGFGHTGKEVVDGLVWTRAQSEYALSLDIAWASAVVNKLVEPDLMQHQFEALVDFVFNAGAGNFANSSLLKFLNVSNWQAADLEFIKWVHSGGKILSGLVNRRVAEAKLFVE